MLGDAVADLYERSGKIKELAEKAVSGDYSYEQIAEMQEELKGLAGEINDIVENTEYNGNRLFSAEGEPISISIGNDSTVDIAAKDFSVDVEDMNLFAEPNSILEKIRREIKAINEFDWFLLGIRERIEEVTTNIQFGLEDILKVESNMADLNSTLELGIFTMQRIMDEAAKALRAQANVEPSKALQLLRETIDRLANEISERETE